MEFFLTPLSWIKDWFLARKDQKRDAHYLAVQVVFCLEEYVEGCAEVAKDSGYIVSLDYRMEPKSERPSPPDYPDNINWKSIDSDLMTRILFFPREVRTVDSQIDHLFKNLLFIDHEFGFEERQLQYARLGLLAHGIIKDLRKDYDISNQNTRDWQPESFFQNIIDTINKDRAERARTAAKYIPNDEEKPT